MRALQTLADSRYAFDDKSSAELLVAATEALKQAKDI
jgi:hypothetical protein